MKNILFVTTQYRVGERIYPIIPKLAKKYNLDLMRLYQMDPNWKWTGDDDLRKYFDNKYLKFFDKVYNNIDIDYSQYSLIITDDNRQYNGLADIFYKRKCFLLSCSHGVTDHGYETSCINKSFDGCFVFGNKEVKKDYQIAAGIPANDKLKKYKNIDKKHILIIINYLGNAGKVPTGNSKTISFKSYGHHGFMDTHFKLFDKEIFDSMGLLELQKKYNKPVIIKMKSRPNTDIKSDTDYLKSIINPNIDYKIIYDIEDDNKLIAESELVISAPGTLALKPIQLKIPTALIIGTGQTGIFYDYEGLVDADNNKITEVLSKEPSSDFINNTISGGLNFNSTDIFTNYVEQCING